MDGLPETLILEAGKLETRGRFEAGQPDATSHRQRTLNAPIGCVGVGLHSGSRVALSIHPAAVDTGIVFRRADLGGITIPARFDHVVDTRLCTMIGLPDYPEARIGTIEHLMAAVVGAGITNAVIEVDGPEVPVLDGSAAPFLFLLDCAGTVAQEARRPVVAVRRRVRVQQGDAFAEFRPARPGETGLTLALSIDFEARAIGRQALTLELTDAAFRAELAAARTFTLRQEVERLREAGLARGGSLENAVVVDQDRVLNPAGLRMRDEFVRHKMLDAVGDLALAGALIRGRFIGHRSGHELNNQLLRALFADACRLGAGGAPRPGLLVRRGLPADLRRLSTRSQTRTQTRPEGAFEDRRLRFLTSHCYRSGPMRRVMETMRLPRFPLVLAVIPLLAGCQTLNSIVPWNSDPTALTSKADPSTIPVEQLYNNGVDALNQHRYTLAAQQFNLVEQVLSLFLLGGERAAHGGLCRVSAEPLHRGDWRPRPLHPAAPDASRHRLCLLPAGTLLL